MTAAEQYTADQLARRDRLIGLAVWVAGEKAKQDLGLPSEWDQTLWVGRPDVGCGTTCCIAGKVALNDGAVPVLSVNGRDVTDPAEVARLWGSEEWAGVDVGRVTFPDRPGEVFFVDDYAQTVLGLDAGVAHRLFQSDNGLPEVIRIIHGLLADIDDEVDADIVDDEVDQ